MNLIAKGVKWTGTNGATVLSVHDREGTQVDIVLDRRLSADMPQLAIEACLQAEIGEPEMTPAEDAKHD